MLARRKRSLEGCEGRAGQVTRIPRTHSLYIPDFPPENPALRVGIVSPMGSSDLRMNVVTQQPEVRTMRLKTIGALATATILLSLVPVAPAYSQDRDEAKPSQQQEGKGKEKKAAKPDEGNRGQEQTTAR